MDARIVELKGACELLTDGFSDLETLILDYIRQVPATGNDVDGADAEQFLQWLAQQENVSEEQKDFIICQRARQTVELVALQRRIAHVRFQELLSTGSTANDSAELTRRRLLHVNPVRVLATLQTHALVEDEESAPATVLFFPVGSEVRSAVVDDEARLVLSALSHGALSLRRLAQAVQVPWPTLLEILEDLSAAGIVAWE